MRKYQIPGQITIDEWLTEIGKYIPEKIKYKAAPRHSWEYYGITKERYKELKDIIRYETYENIVRSATNEANETLSEYILLSTTKNLSYDDLRVLWELKKIERIPCGRSDFYGWRRYFYHLFDLELRRIGK